MRRIILIAILVFYPATAYAYFDPGTGSLIIQALIGAMAGIMVFWGRMKIYIGSFFRKGVDTSLPVDDSTQDLNKKYTHNEDVEDKQ